MKTLSISVPDAVATELLTKRTAAEWKQFLVDVIANELRDIRRKVVEASTPAIVEPDTSTFTTGLV